MSDFGDIDSILGNVGGAVSDLFGAAGSEKAGAAYGTAASIAAKNAQTTLRSTAIQEQQETQQTYQVLGAEKATTAGAGFNNSGGTATDLLRASGTQAALSKQLTENQGELTAQGYEQQSAAYTGQQQSAELEANAQKAAGASKGIGGLFGVVSDVASVVGWVICTELMQQGRMPKRFWVHGSKVFAGYNQYVQEGYHVWAVPSVHHLRSRPFSLYSRLLSCVFNWRAENIAAAASVSGARHLVRGALVTACLWPVCYVIGYARVKMNKLTNWKGLYDGTGR